MNKNISKIIAIVMAALMGLSVISVMLYSLAGVL